MTHNPNHHICIHGHFYQPPRENPWLDAIEKQDSAAPFHDWNARIASECYTALTASAVSDPAGGDTTDLFNCYAHMSFNFGPTLNDWLARHEPETLRRILDADALSRQTYHAGAAMAQCYNHPILPLCDARDRHTQIHWGLVEFRHRFGRPAEGMWLSECGIDMNTVRALIDHGVRYVILSPQQAGYVRRFGEHEWTGVPDGTVETRMPYRLFEVDGAGRTHFDRWLDVIFYDKSLSLQVSFNHLLQDVDRMQWLVRERMDADATLPQIVLIATDGEAYGHHERFGNRTLANFHARMLQRGDLHVTNPGHYLRENPPCWQVRLWEGMDGRGSSWSCDHGIGRWEGDCGCQTGGAHDWNQAWRWPLRQTFNRLRTEVRQVLRREGGVLLRDIQDARDDYIRVLLHPSDDTRAAFLARHAQRRLTLEEERRVWTLLEADRNAMFMYTSCGWFFAELSGIEPVQNMRYALRAAELVQPYCPTDLIALLEEGLAEAKSNLEDPADGREVFRRYVLPTRYSPECVAAAHLLARLLQQPEPVYGITVRVLKERKEESAGLLFSYGDVRCRDTRTTGEWDFGFFAMACPESGEAGVLFGKVGEEGQSRRYAAMSTDALTKEIHARGVRVRDLPFEDRERILLRLLADPLRKADGRVLDTYAAARPLMEMLARNGLPLPPALRAVGEQAMREHFQRVVDGIADRGQADDASVSNARAVLEEAARCHLSVDRVEAARRVGGALVRDLERLSDRRTKEDIENALGLLQFAFDTGLWLENWGDLQDRYWRLLRADCVEAAGDGDRVRVSDPTLRESFRALGRAFRFSAATLEAHLGAAAV